MTSPAITPGSRPAVSERPGSSGGDRPSGDERRAKWRQSVEKARERIRSGAGKGGNGLHDAAKRVSEAVRSGIERARGQSGEGRPAPASQPATSPERRSSPQMGGPMAPDRDEPSRMVEPR